MIGVRWGKVMFRYEFRKVLGLHGDSFKNQYRYKWGPDSAASPCMWSDWTDFEVISWDDWMIEGMNKDSQ